MKLLRCHIILIIIFGSLLHLLSGCGITDESRKSMDRAEALMESAPDSAMTILDSITLGALSSERDKARHALLRSMALDKTFVDTITFDVLQPAIDCYLEKGTPDERLRTLYYQGRIYQNRKEDEEAMKCFIAATDLKNEITDSLTLARMYTARSVLYYGQNRFEMYVKYALAGGDIYYNLNRKAIFVDNMLRAFEGFVLLNDKAQADSVMSVLKEIPDSIVENNNRYIHCKVAYALAFLPKTEIRAMLDSLDRASLPENYFVMLALGYSKVGEGELAKESFDMLPEHYDGDSLQYLSIRS